MGNTIQIDISVTSPEQGEIIIAELSEINFHAFEQNNNLLSLFIKEEYFEKDVFEDALSAFNLKYKIILIPDFNWNQKWENEYTPVVIDKYVAIRATFHKPIKGVEHEIIITPKMSFGTGHHATTYLMLEQMKKLNFKDKRVLDFGTGTGILSILASKSGADKIIAVDNDDWSIDNAKENFFNNSCTNIRLLKTDSIDDLGTFDIILANINLNIITSNIKGLKKASHLSTNLLLSGILRQDEEELKRTFLENGFNYETGKEKEGWICLNFIYSEKI